MKQDKRRKIVLDGDEDDDHTSTFDEWTAFMQEIATKQEKSIEEYWFNHRNIFPGLYKVARKVFSAIPSEAVCERSFSTASFVVNQNRLSLSPDIVELLILGAQLIDIE